MASLSSTLLYCLVSLVANNRYLDIHVDNCNTRCTYHLLEAVQGQLQLVRNATPTTGPKVQVISQFFCNVRRFTFKILTTNTVGKHNNYLNLYMYHPFRTQKLLYTLNINFII